MKKLFVLLALLGLVASLEAATVTNQGQVITVTKLSEVADAGTVGEDQSVYATPINRQGLVVATCKVTESTTSLEFGSTVPKGAILLENGVIEVTTALSPAGTETNSITVGGLTVLSAGTGLSSTGIKAVSLAGTGITSAAGKCTLTITGAATGGVFTVYLPYILGNASR